MTEPLLQCRVLVAGRPCGKCYHEIHATRAVWGRYKGRFVAPHCRHPLQYAVYIDPATRRMLVPYAPAELRAA